MMTTAEAQQFLQDHDNYARAISRQPKAALADLYRRELAAAGIHLLYGGPASKDELISALVGLRFPLGKLNESVHVLHHTDGITSDVCEFCRG